MIFTDRLIDQKLDIMSLLPEELEQFIADMGQPKFRAKQLLNGCTKSA